MCERNETKAGTPIHNTLLFPSGNMATSRNTKVLSLPSNLDNNCTSETSGGSDAMRSRTASSLDALDSSSKRA